MRSMVEGLVGRRPGLNSRRRVCPSCEGRTDSAARRLSLEQLLHRLRRVEARSSSPNTILACRGQAKARTPSPCRGGTGGGDTWRAPHVRATVTSATRSSLSMTATLLATKRVEKPWGRSHLWPGFPDPAPGAAPVGEVWFQTPHAAEPELLIKYLFTSEKLSVQVHPDDAAARAAGYKRGKDEAWVILAAEPHATIALGTKAPMTKEALRAAALDGSIEHLLDWKPVKAGDFIYSPAGVIHAIGPGLTLVEVQQNVDLTYRLYDYGSARELHLDAGVAVSDPVPFVALPTPAPADDDRTILAEGPKFVLERWPAGHRVVELPAGMTGWLIPLAGAGVADGVAWRAGECLTVEGRCEVAADIGSDLLFAYPGDRRV
eukprot:gene25946-33916_t